MFLRARHRIRLGLLVVGCLLFQQVAVAAYACELAELPPAPPAAMEHCSEMMAPAAAESPALCEKHCAPDLTLLTDAAALGVPALALPPAFAIVLDPPAAQVAQHKDVPISRSDPPPRLRYCTLLI
jgi:hypothetical protein